MIHQLRERRLPSQDTSSDCWLKRNLQPWLGVVVVIWRMLWHVEKLPSMDETLVKAAEEIVKVLVTKRPWQWNFEHPEALRVETVG